MLHYKGTNIEVQRTGPGTISAKLLNPRTGHVNEKREFCSATEEFDVALDAFIRRLDAIIQELWTMRCYPEHAEILEKYSQIKEIVAPRCESDYED